MKKTDLSQIDFENMKIPRISKNLKQVCELYRECKYDEAAALTDKLQKFPHQLANIRAQLAFFRWDFDECVTQIIEYYPFLGEWYSGNMRSETKKMLEFALYKASEPVRNEAIGILKEIHGFFTAEQLESRGFEHFKYIPTLIEHSGGRFEKYINPYYLYSPPEAPKNADEIITEYVSRNKKRLSELECAPEDDPATAGTILLRIKDAGRPEDFLKLYHQHCRSPKLIYTHLDAVKIYLYLKKYDKAKEAIINYAKYGWIPVEFTDVKPLSFFVDYSFIPLFDKELFDIIYRTPAPQK